VERILYNLVDNAIKYSPSGGEVKVTARQNGDFLTIGVRDQGLGISEDDQAKLFQRFERLDASLGGIGKRQGFNLPIYASDSETLTGLSPVAV
jgi:two-component system phosphate regulon sensor histidine kinase PhoR